jgi:hypothetical protein
VKFQVARKPPPKSAPLESTPVRQAEPTNPVNTPTKDGGLERVLAAMGAKSEMTKPLKR